MTRDWKSVVRTVAPTVATAMGGPLAGVAVRALGERLLGKADADEDEVAAAVLAASPSDLLRIKEAEAEFATRMAELDVEVEKIEAADRASARQRQVDSKDFMPAAIAGFVIAGFFGLLSAMVFVNVPSDSEPILNIMIGVLGGMIAQITSYYFGSSRGSRQKTVLMGEQIARHER